MAYFNHIKEQIWARIQGCKKRLLSQAGKGIMIKVVVQSIPVYLMSVFKLSVGLCKDIEAMIQKFLSGNGDSKKIHWIKWSSLCSSKSIGGMGFQNFQKSNNAMLAKLVWHLLHHKETLLCKVFSAKYFPNGSILKAPIHPKCSYVWRSILQAQDVINKGAIWRVGNGELIDVWKHQWLPNLACSKIVSPKANSSVTWVCDLFYPNTRIWDLRKLERCFLPWEAKLVGRILVSEGWAEDILIWPLTLYGEYGVRSAYRMLIGVENITLPSSSSSTQS